LYNISYETWNGCCFWSSVKIRGTILVEIILIPESSIIICHAVSIFIFIFNSAVRPTPGLPSECTNVHTLSTFVSVLCSFGCPLLGSPCTSSPCVNCLCHSKAVCKGWITSSGNSSVVLKWLSYLR
jgi:hypothetical protein